MKDALEPPTRDAGHRDLAAVVSDERIGSSCGYACYGQTSASVAVSGLSETF